MQVNTSFWAIKIGVWARLEDGSFCFVKCELFNPYTLVSLAFQQEKILARMDSPLFDAAKKESADLIKRLIEEEKYDVNVRDEDGYTVFHVACEFGGIETVKYLAEYFDPNVRGGEYEETPLMRAATRESAEIVRFLIEEKSADVHITDGNGWNAFHFACLEGGVETVRYLAEYFDDKEVKTKYGNTPLLSAARQKTPEVLKCLIDEFGADLYATDNDERNALHLASLFGSAETVRFLLNGNNFDVNVRGDLQKTPLMYAAQNDDEEEAPAILKVLVEEFNADVSLTDERGRDAFHLCCFDGVAGSVAYLSKFCDPNKKDQYGRTAMHWSAERGDDSAEIIRLLAENGGNLTELNNFGETPLDLAVQRGHEKIAEFIRSKLGQSSPTKSLKGITNSTPISAII